MQSVSSRIWTRVAVSISYDDNHYTMGTSFVVSYGLSTIVGYLITNPLYTHIFNVCDLVRLGFMAYKPLKDIQYQVLFLHIY